MELIADGLLLATALTAALYCIVLSRRLRRLTDSGEGISAQIAALDAALGETRAAMTDTRRGIADARVTVRSAREALDKAVAAAGREREALERSLAAARAIRASAPASERDLRRWDDDAAADGDEMGLTDRAVPDRAAQRRAVPQQAVPEQATSEDDIPDWPNGLVDLPAEAEEALREPDDAFARRAEPPLELGPEHRVASDDDGHIAGDFRDEAELDERYDYDHPEEPHDDGAGAPLRVRRMTL